MGRTVDPERHAARRRLIVEAGLTCFAAHGYAGTSKNLQFWFGYTDPVTTADVTRVLQLSKDAWTTTSNLATTSPANAATPTPVNVSFDGTATAKVRVKYPDVGKLTLNVRDTAATSVVGSGTIIVRPPTFVVPPVTDISATPVPNPAAADATGGKFVAAGTPFKVTVEARNNCPTPVAVKNFGKESSPEGVKLDQALTTGLGLTNNPALTTISDFAEFCVEPALAAVKPFLAHYGDPIGEETQTVQELIVVGMGKLGGGELNVSSDIDLIFVYPEDGQTQGGKIKLNVGLQLDPMRSGSSCKNAPRSPSNFTRHG